MSDAPLTFGAFQGRYTCATLVPGNTIVVTGDKDGVVALRSRSGKALGTRVVGSGVEEDATTGSPVCALALTQDAGRAVVATEDGAVVAYRIDSMDTFEFDRILMKTALPARALAMSRDDMYMYACPSLRTHRSPPLPPPRAPPAPLFVGIALLAVCVLLLIWFGEGGWAGVRAGW
jgi:hypothetical protein